MEAKQTYKKAQVLEPYFTGGAARITRDGKLLACVCGEEVKVRKARVQQHSCSTASCSGTQPMQACQGHGWTQPYLCSCTIQVVDIATGAVLRTIEGVRSAWRLCALAYVSHCARSCSQAAASASADIFWQLNVMCQHVQIKLRTCRACQAQGDVLRGQLGTRRSAPVHSFCRTLNPSPPWQWARIAAPWWLRLVALCCGCTICRRGSWNAHGGCTRRRWPTSPLMPLAGVCYDWWVACLCYVPSHPHPSSLRGTHASESLMCTPSRGTHASLMCTRKHTHLRACTHAYTLTQRNAHALTHTRTQTHTHTHIHTRTQTPRACDYAQTSTCTGKHVRTCARTHARALSCIQL